MLWGLKMVYKSPTPNIGSGGSFLNYRALILLCLLFIGDFAKADPNTFEVDTVTLNSTLVAMPDFTTVTFATPFVTTPLVFAIPTQQGGDACAIRIQNVTTDDFEAACVEPDNFDGGHIAMDMHYIAITSGEHDIDISGGGTVTFEAGSIDTDTVQHNCASGCGTEGYDTVSFSASFSTAPVVLAQVQTMENETNDPPDDVSEPFLTTAIRTGSITSSQFELALERSEENDGSITDDETIAWLAVEETSGCTTLDFSDIGGPSSVAFEAIITDDDIDGWGNGCDSGEGASFSSGCFSSNPIVVATKRTHDGGDGGWLRRCSLSTSEVRFTVDEDTNRDSERNHTSERASVLAFGSAFTTPVSLSHVKVGQKGRKLKMEWQTATETFNLGFNIWGNLYGEWIQLNKRFLPSKNADALYPQKYKKKIKLTREQRDNITEFGISTIDTAGTEEFYGPFESGETYGELSVPEAIDWSAIREEYERNLRNQGYELWRGRWISKKHKRKKKKFLRKLRKSQIKAYGYGDEVVNIIVDKPGIYRITYEQLTDLNLDWSKVRLENVAVTFDNQAVPRFIWSADRKKFVAGSYIDFYADVPKGEDALYRKENVYQIRIDKNKAISTIEVASQIDQVEVENEYLQSYFAGENIHYSVSSPGVDPWVDSGLFAFSGPIGKVYDFDLPDTANFDRPAQLKAHIYGGLDLPGDILLEPDHHLEVWVNGEKVADEFADGFHEWQLQIELPANLLEVGNNTVEIKLPGDTGKLYDLVYINNLELSVFEPLEVEGDSINFPARPGATDYAITGFSDNELVAYAYQKNGNLRKLAIKPFENSEEDWGLNLKAINTQDDLADLNYWVSSNQQLLQPKGIYLAESENLAKEMASYLIIAHPSFIGSELEEFAQAKTDQGLIARIVDLNQIVEIYGYGNQGPKAIKRFLQAANEYYNYDYVLLVGGNSYDYHDYKGQGTIDFIPAYYRQVRDFAYAPTDTPYIDLNDDGLPDKAIGRWPVRTLQDLGLIIQKTNEWSENGMQADRSALLIAEQYDGKGHNFAKQLDSIKNWLFTPNPKPQKGGVLWSEVNEVYLGPIIESGVSNPIGEARQQIYQHINSGAALTIFDGHSSPSGWTFQGLVTWDNLSQLENDGLPTLVMPLACYTTFYETPAVNTLAHQWLFSGNRGAAAIHGASVYSGFRANSQMAKKILTHQFSKGKSVGKAILDAKREFLPGNDLINNWALLGDPSMVLEP